MQHHGAPTRLLDFTYSIHVAAFFALEDAEDDCVVWALNGDWAFESSAELLSAANKPKPALALLGFQEEHEDCFTSLFLDYSNAVPAACPLNPFRLDERLRTQKGVFLVPGDIRLSLEENLRALQGHDEPANVVKLILPRSAQEEARRSLFRMNVSRVSLFPGLDGFAQSLRFYHPVFERVCNSDTAGPTSGST